ncbi:stomatin-like protein 1 isoform X3 [Rhinatrema bivittatum]|uniref:stomatin-like protein 1 isoform X3 n=1 Tax=Rhinatrema bivittatum TaxID=194408 RepID=UPI001129A52F|nr:stomatin-like protein 1 isoform X3 [Rhinatrema bivittatum]
MFDRSGYQALPMGDFDRFPSDAGLYGSQKSFFHLGPVESALGYITRTPGQDFPADKSQSWLSWICHGIVTILVFALLVLTFPISAWFALKIIPHYERIVVFRLGRVQAPKGPGVVLLLPFIDHWQRVDLRTRAFNVPPCKVTTKDGAVISVGADIQFRIWNPVLSVMSVQCLNTATRMTAQNLMTTTLSKKLLREVQMEKLRIGDQLLVDINEKTKFWGLEVDRVELIFEAVLKPGEDMLPGPLMVPPAVSGLEGLVGPIQQLAMHLLSNSLAGASQSTDQSENLDTSESVEVVNEVDSPPPPPPLVPSPCKTYLGADELILAVELFLSESLVRQVGACYQFNITRPGGQLKTYFLDLTAGKGKAGHGEPEGKPDVILEMSETDLQAMVHGDLQALGAYMSGRLQVRGDFRTTLKLEEVFKAMMHR